jgi:hypothetical protein
MSTKKTKMHFERDEYIGILVSLAVAIFFFAAFRFDLFHRVFSQGTSKDAPSDVAMIGDKKDMSGLMRTLGSAMTNRGKIIGVIAEDSKVGTGAEVKEGSHVTVQYIGMLQNGTQFDNSYSKGQPFSFTVGDGSVIKGWDTGVVGMKEGGERILVIPPDQAYGNREVGTIPANSTLLFSIELLKVE